ncbi:hypothetical protein D3C77_450110 [compost metagenome]
MAVGACVAAATARAAAGGAVSTAGVVVHWLQIENFQGQVHVEGIASMATLGEMRALHGVVVQRIAGQ